MLTRNFTKLQADQVAQGSYKTGSIGCLAGGKNDPEYIEREYGVPLMVSRLAESIFRGLPPGEAPEFFAAFLDAIETDGKDLSTVGWQFLAAELRALPTVPAGVQAKIDPVIAGIDLLAEGKEWPAYAAAAAAAAVYAAADDDAADFAPDAAAAVYAGCAVYADAYADTARAVYADAADAAYANAYVAAAAAAAVYGAAADVAALGTTDPILAPRRQRDTLLKLIKEAPITTQGNS